MMKLCDNRGITLIELLVTLSILGIVLAGAMSFFLFSIKQYKKEDAQWQIQQDARFALREITEEVRAAKEIMITNEGSPELLSSGNVLTLDKYELDSDPSDLDVITVQIKCANDGAGNKVLRRIANGGHNTIINNVDSITFSTDDSAENITTLNITLTTKLPEADNKFTVSTRVSKRIGVN